MSNKPGALRLALEALENSVDLVQAECQDNWRHGMPTRASQLAGLQKLAEDHVTAITALRAEIAALEKVEAVAWAISYDGKTPYMLWGSDYGAQLDLEVRRVGGTACKLPLYATPVAPSIPALTDEEAYGHADYPHAACALAKWAYALAAKRAGVAIK